MGTLSAIQVANLTEPGTYEDGEGLRLVVKSAGTKSWIFRFQLDGKRRDMGLGGYPKVSLKVARAKAGALTAQLVGGADPLAARDAERTAKRQALQEKASRSTTFEALANEYLEIHGRNWSEGWRDDWNRKLRLYVLNHIGNLPPSDIGTEQVLKILRPIWSSKTRTADEVRSQIERVLDAAKAHGLREGENPARWRGHLDNLLSKSDKKAARKGQRFPAMKWKDVPELMLKLADDERRDSFAIRLLLLTGARAGTVRFAPWVEFDLTNAVWSIPADRMKTGVAFDIPLSPAAVALLQGIPRIDGSPYLFPGKGKTGVMHKGAMRLFLHGIGHADITNHGFRSSFRTWASDCTKFDKELCELALAHDQRTKTEGAYDRSDFFEKRRELMTAWGQFITTPPSANVIQGDFKRA
ncbi:tyrosine-type recombinase/integrase [Pseudomonas spirodelae]|uniref:Integrase arm-type DNA-binding domain-containing protein n=1 Tax=Pseudomonas spirodelae TaxID=3101751 RepID=A0ABU5P7L4_9PSED|nr:integrase arm-type DNA-binding domain-containing protein [Pseudomonas sp. T5W1]MEA1605585.1 integrase arm-type DNA-binding domain-containing protein [Pseudomonas sp. T5W1]